MSASGAIRSHEVLQPVVALQRVSNNADIESSDDDQSTDGRGERQSTRDTNETPRRGHKVNRGQHLRNADTSESHTATRRGRHSSRLESANSHGTTGGTRARGSVEFVSVSTRGQRTQAILVRRTAVAVFLNRPRMRCLVRSWHHRDVILVDHEMTAIQVLVKRRQIDLHARHAGTGSGDNDDCTRLVRASM